MMETSFFLDEDKNIFAFKGKISEGDVSLSTENSEHQKKYSCDSNHGQIDKSNPEIASMKISEENVASLFKTLTFERQNQETRKFRNFLNIKEFLVQKLQFLPY